MLAYRTPFSYGYNVYGGGTPEDVPPSGLGSDVAPRRPRAKTEIRVSRVRLPAEMIAIADGQGDAFTDLFISVSASSTAAPGTVHHGGANVLYCDGHVHWRGFAEITVPNRPGVDSGLSPWREIVATWRNDHAYP